ncbi:IclR family transcriptional regulator [Mesobacterium pallidum]|uniref:IclR family transcriptional regulator n=1 Tax=Mesobacterium pallidum TaxID=2872037 RepID=UPI001EE26E79|nr:IclR family transcriptional regulator [Mesobacterium pallidum]
MSPTTPTARKPRAQKSEGRGVQSIELGARLLFALCQEGEPMMLKDLAKLAGFAPAQAHAYLVSYRKIGLVEQDAASGRYRLGHHALDLGMAAMRTTDTMALAGEVVRNLSADTELNVATVVWGSFGPTVIQVEESGRQLNMNTRPGTVYSMTGTASGRVFSAFLADKIVKDAMAREKREAVGAGRVGRARFMSKSEIEEIRERGWATVEDAPVPGISAYAAPVFDHTEQIVMAITIIGQDHYLEPRAREVFVPALLEATARLSNELGYRVDA